VQDVAGYRVLRTAGRGDRARVLLGFDDGLTVVLKITPSADPLAFAELAALDRAAGDHVVGVLDVSADGEETVLVLERLAKGTLAELLERRRGLEVGEAVTVLAPIATTLERLHAAGVAHGRVSLSAICFRDDGAPTLIGFGNAVLFAPGAPEVVRETVPGVLADREAITEICRLVLTHVVGARAEAARRLAEHLGPGAAPAELADRLFALAPASPVRFDDDVVDDVHTARVGMPHGDDPTEEAPERVLPPWITTMIPDWITERIEPALAAVTRIWSGWERRRRRLAVATVAASFSGLAALALIPAPPAASSAPDPAPSASPVAAASQPSLPDDPVEAVVLLLDLRERCVRDLSLLCLDDVVQPDSSAQAEDVAAIRAIQAGGEYPVSSVADGQVVLVEQLGDAALLDLPPGSNPASVLLMRTTNGWRIRQYFDVEYRDAPAVPTVLPPAEPG
jgi:hypothetical protein